MQDETLFLTAASPSSLTAARLMIDSLRSFGGRLATAPVWVFSTRPQALGGLESGLTRLLPLDPPASTPCLFAEKVAACARAEALAPKGTGALVWIDPACLVVQEPGLFALDEASDAALRPVHIRNVGLPPGEPLDAFWGGIYAAAGIQDVEATVTSFVDGQRLRAYFNTHAFAVNPALGLMQAWQELFTRLAADQGFLARACPDEPHQVFLFQAVLSTLLAARIAPGRLRLLPPVYNYPYNLHSRIPPALRAEALNDLVCFPYEERSIQPGQLSDVQVREPLRTWLLERLRPAGGE